MQRPPLCKLVLFGAAMMGLSISGAGTALADMGGSPVAGPVSVASDDYFFDDWFGDWAPRYWSHDDWDDDDWDDD